MLGALCLLLLRTAVLFITGVHQTTSWTYTVCSGHLCDLERSSQHFLSPPSLPPCEAGSKESVVTEDVWVSAVGPVSPKVFFFPVINFLLFYLCSCFAHSTSTCVVLPEIRKGHWVPELELQTVVSCPVEAGTQTWLLWNRSQ